MCQGVTSLVKSAVAGFLLIVVFCTACRQADNSNRERSPTPTPSSTPGATATSTPSPATVPVSKVASLITLQVECDDDIRIWAGPASNVFVKLTGSESCPVKLMLIDKVTHQLQPTGNSSSNPAGDPPVQIRVPEKSALICACGGEGDGKCACEITQVDPDLPAGKTAGTPTTITPGAPQNNPGTAPPAGTKVTLDCGKRNVPLWSGNQSYVTVTFQGSPSCTAHVTGRITGEAGSEETVDKDPFCRTFGPVTELTASCVGGKNEKCQFQVTQVTAFPK